MSWASSTAARSASAATVTAAVRNGIDQIDRALPFDWSGNVVVYSVQSPNVLASFTDVPGWHARAPRRDDLPDVRRERAVAGGLDADAGDAELGARRASRSSAGSPGTS